jgi:hypothetical protein
MSDAATVLQDDTVEKTWEEVGYRVRPLRWMVFVRTDPIPQKVGSIYLPFKLQTFYGELPHLQVVTATVLSVGPKALGLQPGDRVAFARLHFARWLDMADGTKVGWIDANQIAGYAE